VKEREQERKKEVEYILFFSQIGYFERQNPEKEKKKKKQYKQH